MFHEAPEYVVGEFGIEMAAAWVADMSRPTSTCLKLMSARVWTLSYSASSAMSPDKRGMTCSFQQLVRPPYEL